MKSRPNRGLVQPEMWDDLRFPASAVKQNPATSKPDFDVWRSGIRTLVFDGAANEEVHFNAQLPHGFKFGTKLEFHVHWAPMTSPNDGHTVIWHLEYTLAQQTEVFPVSTTSAAGTKTFASNSQYEHVFTEILSASAGIDTSAWNSLSGMLSCRLYRDAVADTYPDEVAFFEADFHFQKDQVGSKQELIK